MSDATHTECPKCESPSAYFRVEGPDLWLRCLCGYCRVVATTLEEMVIQKVEDDSDVRLPKTDSKLWRTLVTLAAIQPANTDEIGNRVNRAFFQELTNSMVGSQLTVLRFKRLVQQVDSRRGFKQGSTWICTPVAERLLGLKKG